MRQAIILLVAVIVLAACATTPYTERWQFMLVSEGQEMSLGDDSYRHILRDSVVTRDGNAERIVRKVGERIARAAERPQYQWEFSVINDPDTVNAFAVPGGKVAVYTGIFPAAKDEAGLAVVLGHEVAHALLRHPAERMSQGLVVQVVGAGLGVALSSNPVIANQVLQAYGIGAGVGVMLPFGRAQETEADRVGLILMAKAGYDPRVALEVWERMEKKDRGQQAPPEYLSTHPGYETRVQNLRNFIPEAMAHYRPAVAPIEALPDAASLDTPTARAERELHKRMAAINLYVEQQNGERAVVEALAYELRLPPRLVVQERQQLQIGYGQYAALRGVAHLGRGSISNIAADYQSGRGWSDIAGSYGSRIHDLTSWMGSVIRTTNGVARQLSAQPYRSGASFP